MHFISIHAPPRGATIQQRARRAGVCISIHAPPRGATEGRKKKGVAQDDFNSRPSARGDEVRARFTQQVKIFQFTPLREGRRKKLYANGILAFISIHAPPRGATCYRLCIWRLARFQFTPLREGRRELAIWVDRELFISIHAPPRGATPIRQHLRRGLVFQFTPLREGRRKKVSDESRAAIISIHAPPRGATPSCSPDSSPSHFNSRPSARGDVYNENPCAYHLFQFTPLREGRR